MPIRPFIPAALGRSMRPSSAGRAQSEPAAPYASSGKLRTEGAAQSAVRSALRCLMGTSVVGLTITVGGMMALPSAARADSCSDQAASNYNACTMRGIVVCTAAGVGSGPWGGAVCSVFYRQACLSGQAQDMEACDTSLDPNNSNAPYPVEDWSNISEGAPSAPPGDYGSPTEGTSGSGAGMGDPEPSTDERNV